MSQSKITNGQTTVEFEHVIIGRLVTAGQNRVCGYLLSLHLTSHVLRDQVLSKKNKNTRYILFEYRFSWKYSRPPAKYARRSTKGFWKHL